MRVTYVVQVGGEPDTHTKSNDVNDESEDLNRGVESDKSLEAEKTNGDGADREKDDECESSHDTVSDQNALLTPVCSVGAELIESVATRAARVARRSNYSVARSAAGTIVTGDLGITLARNTCWSTCGVVGRVVLGVQRSVRVGVSIGIGGGRRSSRGSLATSGRAGRGAGSR